MTSLHWTSSNGSRRPPGFRLDAAIALMALRMEWQKAAQPEGLLVVHAPVGLMLVDVVQGLRFDVGLQATILGPRLYREVQNTLSQRL